MTAIAAECHCAPRSRVDADLRWGRRRSREASLAYLARLCQRWGGELLLVSAAQFSLLFQASLPRRTVHPLGAHAIDVEQRLVIAERRRANPGTIIHEMGHVFLAEGDPDQTYEPDWLGWEISLARRARCYRTWSEQNADYMLLDEEDSYIMWKDLRGRELRERVARLVDDARATGLVDSSGAPLCTRRGASIAREAEQPWPG